MNFIHNRQNFTIWHAVLPWDLTCLTFLYRWLSPCSTSSTLTVRSVPTGCTGRVSTPCVGSTQHRWLHHPTDLRGVRVRALWRSPLQSDRHCTATPGPRRLVRLEFYLLGIYYPRGRRVSSSQSADELLWPQPHRGSSLVVQTVSCRDSSRPSMVGPYGSPTGVVVARRAIGCHSDAGSLS
jgi:hypothetical protein